MIIPVLVAVLGIALGAGGIGLLRRFGSGGTEQLTTTAEHQAAAKPLSAAAIKARVEPSIVDVTATLTYDDETASGTGFVVAVPPTTGPPTTGPSSAGPSSAGAGELILTNNHVLRDATSVIVTVPATGQIFTATIVGVDVTSDIGILSVSPSIGLPTAPIGDSAGVGGGTSVVSFGNQAGEGGSPTVAPGAITGTGRTIQADDGAAGFSETLHGMLATSALIEPGDSGGPLAGTGGTIIGVDTAAGTDGSTTGYAIPIDAAMAAARQIIGHHPGQGVVLGVDGFLGVLVGRSRTASSPQQQRQAFSGGKTPDGAAFGSGACVPSQADAVAPAQIAPTAAGALVAGVLCGTGAAQAGIVPGDVVTVADGQRIDSPGALTSLVSGSAPGGVMQVTWVTPSGTTRTARVRLSPAPAV